MVFGNSITVLLFVTNLELLTQQRCFSTLFCVIKTAKEAAQFRLFQRLLKTTLNLSVSHLKLMLIFVNLSKILWTSIVKMLRYLRNNRLKGADKNLFLVVFCPQYQQHFFHVYEIYVLTEHSPISLTNGKTLSLKLLSEE